MKNMINNLINYRHLIVELAIKDFKLRYKNSVLGFLWSLIEPLLIFTVLYIVFTNLMSIKVENYQIFLLIGIISWNMFSRGTNMGLNAIIGKSNLVKKIYFPREILVVSSCLAALFMTFLEFVVIGIFMIIFSVKLSMTAVYFPIILFFEFLLIVGISFSLSVLNVYYRDIQYIWAIIIQVGFFATPIMYPMSIIPENRVYIMMLNPMTRIIESLRGTLMYSKAPSSFDMIFIIGTVLAIIIMGYIIFLRLEPRLAEEL